MLPPAMFNSGTGTTAILNSASNTAAAIFETKKDLGQGVVAGPLPAWAHDEEFIREAGRFYDDELREAKYAFLILYDCGALGQPHPAQPDTTCQDAAYDTIRLANMSLWIANPSPLSIRFVVHVAGGRGSGASRVTILDPVTAHPRNESNILTVHDINQAKCLFTNLSGVPRTSALRTSAKFLWKTLTEVGWWEVRYVTTWIALEALFGPESPGETTFKICQRIAFFLSDKESERLPTYQKAHELYEPRCKLVHGRLLKNLYGERSLDVSFEAEEMLRLSLRKILLDTDLTRKFSSETEREKYLTNLVFSGSEATPHPDPLPPAEGEGKGK